MKWSWKLSCLSAVINDQRISKRVARHGEVMEFRKDNKFVEEVTDR